MLHENGTTERTRMPPAAPPPATAGLVRGRVDETSSSARRLPTAHRANAALTIVAFLLTACLALAVGTPSAIAAEGHGGTSVGVTLAPVETVRPDDGGHLAAPETSASDLEAGAPAAGASETAALPQTGDALAVAVPALLLAIAVAVVVLALGKALPHARRRPGRRLMGIALAGILVVGAAPAALAHADESNGQDAVAESASAGIAPDDALEKRSEEGGEATVPSGSATQSPESERSDNAVDGQASTEVDVLRVTPDAGSVRVVSPLATSSSTVPRNGSVGWGDYECEIIGEPIVGKQITIVFHPDPDLPDSVTPRYRWYYAPFSGIPFIEDVGGNSPTLTVPEEALGMNLHVEVTDATGYVTAKVIFVPGRVGYELVGSVAVQGSPQVGSTLNAVLSGLPKDCGELDLTWYSGSKPGATDKKLGTGSTLELTGLTTGKYVTVTASDPTRHYRGTLTATTGPVTNPLPEAPTVTDARILPDGTLSALCRTDGSPDRPTSAVALEYAGADGSWVQADRADAPDAQAPCDVRLSADLSSQLANGGSVRVRAVAYNEAGASAASAEKTVAAQLGITVPISMDCRVSADGSARSDEQSIVNTGALNAAVSRIETSPAGTGGGRWTCTAGDALLFEGPFGGSQDAPEALPIAPGESLAVGWTARGLSLNGLDVSDEPTPYGTVTYVVSAAL